jgi:hypothetical protein
MRRIYINAFLGNDADPPVGMPAARENERNVLARRINDS